MVKSRNKKCPGCDGRNLEGGRDVERQFGQIPQKWCLKCLDEIAANRAWMKNNY